MENKVTLPFPIQNTMTTSLRQLAGKVNNGEFQSLWAGEDFKKVRSLKARDLVLTLKKELLCATT